MIQNHQTPCASYVGEHTALLKDISAALDKQGKEQVRQATVQDAILAQAKITNGRTHEVEERVDIILQERLPKLEAQGAGEQAMIVGWAEDRRTLHQRISRIGDAVDALALKWAAAEGKVSGGWKVAAVIGSITFALGGLIGSGVIANIIKFIMGVKT